MTKALFQAIRISLLVKMTQYGKNLLVLMKMGQTLLEAFEDKGQLCQCMIRNLLLNNCLA